jgi:hypothetical protein
MTTDGRTDGRTDGQHHNIIRPVFRRAYKNHWYRKSIFKYHKNHHSSSILISKIKSVALPVTYWALKPRPETFTCYILGPETLTCYILRLKSSSRERHVWPHPDVHVPSVASVGDRNRKWWPAMFHQLRGVWIHSSIIHLITRQIHSSIIHLITRKSFHLKCSINCLAARILLFKKVIFVNKALCAQGTKRTK